MKKLVLMTILFAFVNLSVNAIVWEIEQSEPASEAGNPNHPIHGNLSIWDPFIASLPNQSRLMCIDEGTLACDWPSNSVNSTEWDDWSMSDLQDHVYDQLELDDLEGSWNSNLIIGSKTIYRTVTWEWTASSELTKMTFTAYEQ